MYKLLLVFQSKGNSICSILLCGSFRHLVFVNVSSL
jgi:hypothetical protein